MKGVAASAKRLSVKYQILLLLVVLCLFPFLGLLLYTVHDSVNAIHRPVSYTHLDVYKRQILSRCNYQHYISITPFSL